MKYKCCNLLTGGIEFRYNGIALCQRVDHIGGGDIVVQTYDDKKDKTFHFNIEKYFEKKREVIQQNKTGKIYCKCEGCVELHERDWPEVENQKIFQMILHHWTKCNSHCIYCYTNKDKEYFNKRRSYKFLPILKQLDKKNLLEYGGICSFAGGEISCLNEFENILKILDKYDFVSIFNSSCVKYEKSVAKHLKKGNGLLVVSVDSGTKELHNKIKQVDSYEKVWSNITKYAKAAKRKSLIYTKYIVLKDINDNEQAITDFLVKSKESGVKYVLMEIDHYYFCENRNNIPKYIVDLFYFAFNKAKEIGLNCQIYSNSSVLLLQGQWADEFWHSYVFNAGTEINKYSFRNLYKIDKQKRLTKYEDIKTAAASNNLLYSQIWNACEKTKNRKYYTLKSNIWVYAEDIEQNDSSDINTNKLNTILSRKKILNIFSKQE